jgi:hypothetical protein
MRIDYPELEVLTARARRERAEAVYTLLIAPVVRLFTRGARSAPRPNATARHVPA